jgi:hypothetical protein
MLYIDLSYWTLLLKNIDGIVSSGDILSREINILYIYQISKGGQKLRAEFPLIVLTVIDNKS